MRWAILLTLTVLVLGCGAPVGPTPTTNPPTPSPVTATIHPNPPDPCGLGTICALNPDVTQATINTTICVRGWTATIRPPQSYTEPLKQQQLIAENLPGSISSYEEDHRMPLELGGSPRDPHNLSPEAYPGATSKDQEESNLKTDVCSHILTLRQAQQKLVDDWLGPWPTYRR